MYTIKHTVQQMKIKKIRKIYGITQPQMAEDLSVPKGTIKRLESGSLPAKEMYLKYISLMYHINYDWLRDPSEQSLKDESYITFNPMHQAAILFKQLRPEHKKIVVSLMSELVALDHKDARNTSTPYSGE